MRDGTPAFQLNVYGEVNLTINHVEAVEAAPAAAPEDTSSRPKAGSLIEIGGRWVLQVAAAVTSSAAAIGLLSVLGIG